MKRCCNFPDQEATGPGPRCEQEGTIFYAVHKNGPHVFNPPYLVTRCPDHPIKAWRRWIVDEATFLVAEVMES